MKLTSNTCNASDLPGLIRSVLPTLLFVFSLAQNTEAGPLDTWTVQTNTGPAPNVYFGFASGNGKLITVGSGTPSTCATSDGTSWAAQSLGNLNDICFGQGKFVAVGSNIRTSTNGTAWDSRAATFTLFNVAFGNNLFVAVGPNGRATSTNGLTWTFTGVPQLKDVAFGNGRFVISVAGGVYTSTDGTAWVYHSNVELISPETIVYGNGLWVAAGFGGRIVTSTNLTMWTYAPTPTTSHLWSSSYANGVFLVGGDSVLLSSEDGTNWTKRALPISVNQTVWVGGVDFQKFYLSYGSSILSSGDIVRPWMTLRSNGSGLTLDSTGEIGRSYLLQSSEDLMTWDDRFTFTNTAFTMKGIPVPASTNTAEFYRLRVEP